MILIRTTESRKGRRTRGEGRKKLGKVMSAAVVNNVVGMRRREVAVATDNNPSWSRRKTLRWNQRSQRRKMKLSRRNCDDEEKALRRIVTTLVVWVASHVQSSQFHLVLLVQDAEDQRSNLKGGKSRRGKIVNGVKSFHSQSKLESSAKEMVQQEGKVEDPRERSEERNPLASDEASSFQSLATIGIPVVDSVEPGAIAREVDTDVDYDKRKDWNRRESNLKRGRIVAKGYQSWKGPCMCS